MLADVRLRDCPEQPRNPPPDSRDGRSRLPFLLNRRAVSAPPPVATPPERPASRRPSRPCEDNPSPAQSAQPRWRPPAPDFVDIPEFVCSALLKRLWIKISAIHQFGVVWAIRAASAPRLTIAILRLQNATNRLTGAAIPLRGPTRHGPAPDDGWHLPALREEK